MTNKKSRFGCLLPALTILLLIAGVIGLIASIISSPIWGLLFLGIFGAGYLVGRGYFPQLQAPWKLWPLFLVLWFVTGFVMVPITDNVSKGPAVALFAVLSGITFGLSGLALLRRGREDSVSESRELPEKVTATVAKLPFIGKNTKLLLPSIIVVAVLIMTALASVSQVGLQAVGFIPTNTPTFTPTFTLTPSLTPTPIPTNTSTPTNTPKPTYTSTPTLSPTQTPEPSATMTPISGPLVRINYVNKDAEYVDLENIGSQSQNLAGWRIVSEKGNQVCWLSGSIDSGSTLRVWTDNPTDEGFNCNIGNNIWNNQESDPAVLYNAQGQEVSRYP